MSPSGLWKQLAAWFAILLLTATSQRPVHADNPDKQEGTLVVQVQLDVSIQTDWATDLTTHSDMFKVSCGGTTTYRWIDTLPEAGQPSDDLEVLSSTATLSVNGSGTEITHTKPPTTRKWSYSKRSDPKQVAFAEIIWRNGTIHIPVPYHCTGFRRAGTQTFMFGPAENFNNYDTYGFPENERSFTDKLKQTFEKRAKSFRLSGEASWSGKCHAFGGGACSPGLASWSTPTATYHMTYNVFFNPGKPPDVEVEMVPPASYEQWVPQGKDSEKEIGNDLEVEVVAHKKGDPNKPPAQKVMSYKITLADTSREKGVDSNWPPSSKANDDFDMKIDPDNGWITVADQGGQSAQTKEKGLTDFRFTVDSYDYGGSTRVQVVAELEDGNSVVAHVRGHPDQQSLALPKDENGNKIADAWEHWFDLKNTDATSDEDDTPQGDGDKGDSIPLFDEYRGFHVYGQNERLSPQIKELFVYDPNDLGTGFYPQATRVDVYLIRQQEMGFKDGARNKAIANPNGKGQQAYVLALFNRPVPDGDVGDAIGGPGVPRDILGISIYRDRILLGYGDYGEMALQATIAHEMGHGSNLKHHGPETLDYVTGDVSCRRPDSTVKTWACTGKATTRYGTTKTTLADNCYIVAVQGGTFSGNDQCVMRYDSANFYENKLGDCEWNHNGAKVRGFEYGTDAPGFTLCPSPQGTGVNDTSKPDNKAGNAQAGFGECEHKFCVNNSKH